MQFVILAISFIAASSSLALSLAVALRVKRLIDPLVEEGAFESRPQGRDFVGVEISTYEGMTDIGGQTVEFPPTDEGPWIISFQSVDCSGCKGQLPAYRQYLEAQGLPRDRVFSIIGGGLDGIDLYEQIIGEYSRIIPVNEKVTVADDLGVEVWPTYMIVAPDGSVSVAHDNAAALPRLEIEPAG